MFPLLVDLGIETFKLGLDVEISCILLLGRPSSRIFKHVYSPKRQESKIKIYGLA